MARLEETAYGDMVAQKKTAAKPTQSEINAIKKAAAVQQAANAANDPGRLVSTVTIGGAPAGYMPKVVADAQAAAAVVKDTISEVDAAINQVNAAGAEAGAIAEAMGGVGWVPINTIVPPKDTASTKSKENQDAYALLEEVFRAYGLESLIPVIRGYMEQDLGVEQAKLKLKTEQAYKDRFKGNELRRAKGLNVIDEAAYLELENDYNETLVSYGLSDYFGTATDAASRLARQQKMADVIANDISATEFKDRISTVVTRVNMADTNTKTALRSLYNITDTDLVKYFLNPTEGSAQLKQKVTAAEISGASMTQGLGQTSLGTAEELARLGIDKAEALAGYSKIAGYLPTSEKLSAIYKVEGINYDKATAEEEEFKGLASAKRKRQRLVERETSAFSGSSGTSQVSLKTNTRGQI